MKTFKAQAAELAESIAEKFNDLGIEFDEIEIKISYDDCGKVDLQTFAVLKTALNLDLIEEDWSGSDE